jgi:hypothetical protein
MSELAGFFWIGFQHILDTQNFLSIFNGIDHILFILVLSAVYPVKDWRKILVLVTAFTIGHSLTLALAAFDVVPFNPRLIEILIPVTIFLTALYNFYEKPSEENQSIWNPALSLRYGFALFFGLIHGFAFSNVLRSMFALSGESIVAKLFAFNVGIEAGQIVVVVFVLILSALFEWSLKLRPLIWNQALSGVSGLAAIGIFIVKIVT